MSGWSMLARRAGLAQLRPVSGLREVGRAAEHGQAAAEKDDEKLYEHHIPTSTLQKLILAGGSALVGLTDPWRSDMVAVSGEVTASLATLKSIKEKMRG